VIPIKMVSIVWIIQKDIPMKTHIVVAEIVII
jgi:hypothetical protein